MINSKKIFATVIAAMVGVTLSLSVQANTEAAIAPQYDQLLEQLVNINTDTRNLSGLAEVRALLIPHFAALGLVATTHELADGRRLVSFERPGSQPNILLIGHLDTVFAQTSNFLRLRRESGQLIGPGVIDMKGGIVLMLNVLGDLQRAGKLPNVRVVLNDDEEMGSSYSKTRLRELAKGLQHGLVFEPGMEDGGLVKGQAGVRWFKLSVTGKAAHAGLEPQNGISACVELAQKVTQLAQLSNLARGVNVNPGVIEGGSKPNIVCEKASTTIDVRFQHESDLQKIEAAMEKIRANSLPLQANKGLHTVAELKQIAELPLLPEERTRELLHVAQEIARKFGQDLPARTVGYGSDANNLANSGLQLLVGLGPWGGGMHTDHEHLDLKSWQQRLALTKELLIQLDQPKK